MNKKNILTAAVSLSLVACLSIGATLAYFTDQTENAANVFTTGKIDITLIDETENSNGWKTGVKGDDGITYEEVMPGDILSKRVGFSTAEDASDAYVALKVNVNVKSMPNATATVNADTLRDELMEQIRDQVDLRNESTELWSESPTLAADGSMVFYFNSKVPGGTNNMLLFDHINAPATWGNEYADVEFTIDVQAFAVQAANLTAPTEEGSTAVEQLNELIKKTPMPLG